MKHHEVIVDFNRRGMAALLKRAFARLQERHPERLGAMTDAQAVE
jgi:hypothetical protein